MYTPDRYSYDTGRLPPICDVDASEASKRFWLPFSLVIHGTLSVTDTTGGGPCPRALPPRDATLRPTRGSAHMVCSLNLDTRGGGACRPGRYD